MSYVQCTCLHSESERKFLQSCNSDHQDRTDPAWSGLEHPLGSPNPRAGRWVTPCPLIGQYMAGLASDWLLAPLWPVHWADLDLKLGPVCLGHMELHPAWCKSNPVIEQGSSAVQCYSYTDEWMWNCEWSTFIESLYTLLCIEWMLGRVNGWLTCVYCVLNNHIIIQLCELMTALSISQSLMPSRIHKITKPPAF